LKFRSLASQAVWLDQEEELVKLVPDEFKELPSAKQKLLKKLVQGLSKKLFRVIVICCDYKQSE
jgi:hypothetical protein